MCGITLVTGDMKPKHRDMFLTMLQLDTLRGPHSTGIFSSSKDKNQIEKWVGTPWHNDYNNQRTLVASSKVLIGHNRWATQGAINQANAHPFNHGSLYGVHNGTLRTTWALDDQDKFDVDSENIYYHMSRHGVEATVKLLDGAYALVWYDATDQSTNILRNNERTFYIGVSEGVVVGASEDWMIEVACARNGLKVDAINMVPVGRHLKFLPDGTCEGNQLEMYSPPKFVKSNLSSAGSSSFFDVENTVEVMIEEEHQHHFLGCVLSNGSHLGHPIKIYKGSVPKEIEPILRKGLNTTDVFAMKAFKSSGSNTLTAYTHTISLVQDADEDEGIDYYDHSGIEITKSEFNELTKGGCCWCCSPVAKSRDVVWINHEDFVCSDCAEQPEVKEYLNASNLGLVN